jgi:hypothetical protein
MLGFLAMTPCDVGCIRLMCARGWPRDAHPCQRGGVEPAGVPDELGLRRSPGVGCSASAPEELTLGEELLGGEGAGNIRSAGARAVRV